MFRRGISKDFVGVLARLAAGQGWWSEVLADPELIVAIRDEYLNIYWQGQSLFHVSSEGSIVRARSHPKYLLDPSLTRLVSFDGDRFALPSPDDFLLKRWERGITLAKMKKAAGLYAGEEKRAVHRIVRANPSVIDVEIAFRRETPEDEEDEGARKTPRVDALCLEPDGAGVRLAFWEVKMFGNGEVRAKPPGRPPVLDQIEDYRRILEAERPNVLHSYRTVAKNIVAIAAMRTEGRGVSTLVERVAAEPGCLMLGSPPDVGLVVTGFDGDQRDGKRWEPHRTALIAALPLGRTRIRGNPDGFKL